MFFNQLLDRFDLHVEAHLDGCEHLFGHLADHLAGDMVELIIKVCLF